MIYFLSPDQPLAAGLRAGCHLKKRPDIHALPVFAGENALLCHCPAGPPRAAGAAGFLCGLLPPAPEDWFVYLSIDGEVTELAWSVTDCHDTRYPDLLFRHPFGERPLEDGAAYAVYAVVSAFFRAHHICLVSLPTKGLEKLIVWLAVVTAAPQGQIDTAYQALVNSLPLTAYQKIALTKALAGYAARHGQAFDLPSSLSSEGPPPPARGKEERNRWYARLMERING